MNLISSTRILGSLAVAMLFLLTSCTVDQTASQNASGSGAAAKKKSTELADLAEKRKAEREAKAKERAATLAAKKKADEAAARKLALEKKKKEEEKKALALKKAREAEAEKAAEAKKKAQLLAEKKKEQEAKEKARLAARKKEAEERAARSRNREVPAAANRDGSGFFANMAISTPAKYKSKGHGVKVNHRLLNSLGPSNAKIEVDLSEQKARVYKVSGSQKQLVIETKVSTGKSGHSTPTGTYRISEKQVAKRSTLYGRWLNSSGQTVKSDGESAHRPSGATTFVGAEMPYWMRVNGGIGMHVGYVPNQPASHGCIRVPSAVQPLIFSKVGVGTTVSIVN